MIYFINLFRGRVNRKTYLLGSEFLLFLYTVVPFLTLLLFSQVLDQQSTATIILIVITFLAPCYILYSISLTIRRLHDLNKSYLVLLFGIIPYIGGLILFIYIAFWKGQSEINKYGEPPKIKKPFFKEIFNPPYLVTLQDTISKINEKSKKFGYRINISSHAFAKFAYIQINPSSIVLATLNENIATIARNDITKIEIKSWMIFNYKITIKYQKDNKLDAVEFASGDLFSTNMLKTVYLYRALKKYQKTGEFNHKELGKSGLVDRIPIALSLIAAYGLPYLLIQLYGFHGVEYVILEFLAGCTVIPYSLMIIYVPISKNLIKEAN